MSIRINKQQVAITIFLIGTCFRWFFTGILGGIRVEILILFVAIILLLLQGKFNKKMLKLSSIWLLYGFSIFFNLYIKDIHSTSISLYAIMLLEILFFLFLLNAPVDTYKQGVKFIAIYGIINAIFVLIHFALGDTFTALYYGILNSDGQILAENYVNLGHYFGFFYMPSDPAGFISYAIVVILLGTVVFNQSRMRKWLYLVIIIILLVSLLLTGKKGVLFCGIIAFSLMMLLLYASKRQWLKALRYIIIGAIILTSAYLYIVFHADNPVIARLSEFFTNLSTGERYDSYRSVLYGYAFEQWASNKMFGIGWRQFNRITVNLYGMPSGHEVNRDYLQLLCETGILGLILTLIPLIVMLWRTIFTVRRMLKAKQVQMDYSVIAFAGFIQLFFVLYAFVEIPFYDYTFFAVYIFSCAIINRAYAELRGYVVRDSQIVQKE